MSKSYLWKIALPLASLLIAGCSKSGNTSTAEADAEKAADAAKQDAQHEELKSSLAKGMADVQKSVDASTSELKAEMEKQKETFAAELEKQKTGIISEFEASNSELASQVASLKSQYEKLSAALPEAIAKQLDGKISDVVGSLKNLQGLVSSFDPDSIEQISEFKTKYEKELSLAKDLIGQAMKLLESKNISLPKLP